MKIYKLLVAGSRTVSDYDLVARKLDHLVSGWMSGLASTIIVIEGEAPGVDLLAKRWATERGHGVLPMPADWDKHGRPAGYVRNVAMADQDPDAAVLFWDGKSPGTTMMRNILDERDIPYRLIRIDNPV